MAARRQPVEPATRGLLTPGGCIALPASAGFGHPHRDAHAPPRHRARPLPAPGDRPLLTSLVLGAIAAAALVAIAHLLGPARERRVLAAGLVVAGLLYVGFAALARADAAWIMAELASTAVFTLFAVAGVRTWPGWLAIGWAAHVLWDVAAHRGSGAPGYAPGWYPVFCIGFDLTVAAWLFSRARPA